MVTEIPPGRQLLDVSRDSTTPVPAGLLGDIRSAARSHGLMRIAGFIVGAGVCMSLEPAPVVGGPQLVFGIYKPPRPPKQPNKAAAANLPKAVSGRRIRQSTCSRSDQSSCSGIKQSSPTCINQGSPRREPISICSVAGQLSNTAQAIAGGHISSLQCGTE
ncbi:TPA: hypothetical protein ACH3X3_002834 [Trebouxia sp. C0006]